MTFVILSLTTDKKIICFENRIQNQIQVEEILLFFRIAG